MAETLRELNPNVDFVYEKVGGLNIITLIDDTDIVVDALDNWETRFIASQACSASDSIHLRGNQRLERTDNDYQTW